MQKHMKTLLEDDSGMTLMEVIIAVLLLSIVTVAAFNGLQYAFFTLQGAQEFSENVYVRQQDYEEALSYALSEYEETVAGQTISSPMNKVNMDSLVGNMIGADTSITFDWDMGVSFSSFDSSGILYTEAANGSTYLSDPIYVFIPTSIISP